MAQRSPIAQAADKVVDVPSIDMANFPASAFLPDA